MDTAARESCFDEGSRVVILAHNPAPPPLRVPVLVVGAMTPGAFIAKWRASELKESAAAQSHFNDLCRMLGEPTPTDADPAGEWYCFERGVRKDTGGDGWADVWKRGCFAWEYKGKRANLDAAFNQLLQYAAALENPPLLIVSDMARFRIRTHWTNSVSVTHEFTLDDLADGATRDKLKWAMSDPERLRPGETRQAVTERAAATFAELAQGLRDRGHDPQTVAHFVNRLVFCMFAEDVGLLPGNMFTRMLEHARGRPEEFSDLARDLFGAMATGGRIGFEAVAWFNGGLFDDDTALPLDREGIETALRAAALDWSEIDPSISAPPGHSLVQWRGLVHGRRDSWARGGFSPVSGPPKFRRPARRSMRAPGLAPRGGILSMAAGQPCSSAAAAAGHALMDRAGSAARVSRFRFPRRPGA